MIRAVYEDGALLAVDKPEGVPSQSADPAHPDDLAARVREERGLARLGVHQRLDKEMSGVVIFAKTKSANRGLAEELERRQASLRYVALVEGWTGGPRRLEHRTIRGKDGRTQVDPRNRRSRPVVTHVERVERVGERAFLEMRLESARSHELRAQLAHEGSPIVGDASYGGAPAPRLMLHASSLGIRHPLEDRSLVIEAPVPALFDRWLRGATDPFDPANLREALERAQHRRWGLWRRADSNAYRLLNTDGDGVPGVAVDVYADWLVLHLYDQGIDHEASLVQALASQSGVKGIYVKRRPKQANTLVAASETHAPALPVHGTPAPSPLEIIENGMPLLARLDTGLSTGIFLDQRLNRARVRAFSDGARVLNLFAYTCPFTVAAGLGGARETLSVDASARALSEGRANLDHAGLDPAQHHLEQADCFVALRDLAKRQQRFDVIVVDPPTYSTTKATRWKSGKSWQGLARLALKVLAPGGKMLLCSNDRRMHARAFRRHVQRAADDLKLTLDALKILPPPSDFPGEAQPKSLLCALR